MSYYVETGLMVPEGEQPFTDAGKRLARRQRIAGAGQGAFEVVKGEVGYQHGASSSNADDEIPF